MHATALDMPAAPDLESVTEAVLETMARVAAVYNRRLRPLIHHRW